MCKIGLALLMAAIPAIFGPLWNKQPDANKSIKSTGSRRCFFYPNIAKRGECPRIQKRIALFQIEEPLRI
jgi:hypothetical protein